MEKKKEFAPMKEHVFLENVRFAKVSNGVFDPSVNDPSQESREIRFCNLVVLRGYQEVKFKLSESLLHEVDKFKKGDILKIALSLVITNNKYGLGEIIGVKKVGSEIANSIEL